MTGVDNSACVIVSKGGDGRAFTPQAVPSQCVYIHQTIMLLNISSILQFASYTTKTLKKDVKILLIIIKICYNNMSLHIKLAYLYETVIQNWSILM